MSALYYTKADLQFRRWLISDCIGKKGAKICCETSAGNSVEVSELKKFQLANAYLDLICSYDNLAQYEYSNLSVENRNCISEEQLDSIFKWFEGYCCSAFLPKGGTPSDSNGDISLPPIDNTESSREGFLAMESNAFFLLEESDGDDFIKLEDTTALLSLDPVAWQNYYNNMTGYSYYRP